ncbi:hypothetical protein Syun_010563 [Stephania yunnanensis]|uniref:Uncharacterized protein n=1 Tax=Stephania yunnanensis TaxID=152371 RepID=A0AAP0KII4_9MAGN
MEQIKVYGRWMSKTDGGTYCLQKLSYLLEIGFGPLGTSWALALKALSCDLHDQW